MLSFKEIIAEANTMIHAAGSTVAFPHKGVMTTGTVERHIPAIGSRPALYVVHHSQGEKKTVHADKVEKYGIFNEESEQKFQRATKTAVHYQGQINGKTYIVPHSFHDSYHTSDDSAPMRHADVTPMRHAIVTSLTHVQHNNPTLTPEEVARVHSHIKDIHGGQEPVKLEEGKKVPNPFKVGDQVKLHPEALKHHAQSVPAHAGYTREGFAWRERLKNLEGHVGTVSRVFDSGHTNVDFPSGTIGIHHKSLVPHTMKEEYEYPDPSPRKMKPFHYRIGTDANTGKPKIFASSNPDAFKWKRAKKSIQEERYYFDLGGSKGWGYVDAPGRNEAIKKVTKEHGHAPIHIERAKNKYLKLKEDTMNEGVGVFHGTATYHQTNIAKKTLRMPDAMVGVMGGPNKEEARAHLKRVGWSDKKIHQHEHGEHGLNEAAPKVMDQGKMLHCFTCGKMRIFKDDGKLKCPVCKTKKVIGEAIKHGDEVEISHNYGVDSGKQGTVLHPNKVRTDSRGVPTDIPGAYKPVDHKKEHVVKLHNGSYAVIPKGSLTKLEERTLTPSEDAKKEEIVHSMKKKLQGFKERYGERAKSVMYATATARAKELAEEVTEGQHDEKPSGYKYVGKHKPSGLHIFQDEGGKKELFHRHPFGERHSGWGLKHQSHHYEYVRNMEESVQLEEAAPFMTTYRRNESQNRHTANIVHLAKHFGDKADQEQAKFYADELKKHGHQPHHEAAFALHQKLYPKAVKAHMETHPLGKVRLHKEETKMEKSQLVNEELHAYDVHHKGKHIDTVFYGHHEDPAEVKKSLVRHDGYHPDITVKKQPKKKLHEISSTLKTVKRVLAEMSTRKNFKNVAELIRLHPDAKKRQELADHHAAVFASENPRFSHEKFHAAAGTKYTKA